MAVGVGVGVGVAVGLGDGPDELDDGNGDPVGETRRVGDGDG